MLLTSETKVADVETARRRAPKHVAVIMDGNGRWAKARGWPRSRGHLEGAKAVRECMQGCLDLGIEYLTLYAFSSDNWRRPKEEVDALMGLLKRFLKEYTREMKSQGVRVQAIGRLWELPKDCQEQLQGAIRSTAHNTRLTTILAINYSGRGEIIDAVKRVLADIEDGRLRKEQLDPEIFQRYLYTSHWPDPDLLIRTSGEMRVSDFLLWQVSYTEFFSLQKFWPDFTREDLHLAVEAFSKRQRRYGAV
ncbi:MAG: isoprenyl transferase [Verrucomicrobia bacterium]|nr:isoprenyl transferase [Verrucomicrobiota bacterium]